jgi:5-methylcytosine-specific restriction endonuclease McrA
LICRLEKQKFSATDKPRPALRPTRSARHVPAHLRRAVWQRDQGRCTFVSKTGQRCAARKLLEFDHVTPVAQGGNATTANLRLRCRAHNQYAAERAFGAEFMRHKRQKARERAVAEARKSAATQRAKEQAREHAKEQAQEVIPWLRALGFRADEAGWRAERCEAIPDASLEERVKLALSYLSPRIAARGGGTAERLR